MADGCVVVLYEHIVDLGGHLDEVYCGDPVAGERGGFPMCEHHMDLFDPEKQEG